MTSRPFTGYAARGSADAPARHDHRGPSPAGLRINEGQVGASLGVSRTPLREAIKTLVSEGLVEIVPAKGAIVRKFGERDVFHILEVLKSLEQTAARLLCANARTPRSRR